MTKTPDRSAIVIAIDRLGANQIATYGNTVFETDHLNHWAARSLVFDQALVTTPRLGTTYRKFGERLDWERLGQAGIESVLLSDEQGLLDHEFGRSFDQVIPLPFEASVESVSDASETETAQVFAQLVDWCAALSPRTLGWCHLRGLGGAWDAPYAWRQQRADADDPAPPEGVTPPSFPFDPAHGDPDQLLGAQQSCAAQVQLIDQYLGVVEYLMQQSVFDNTLVCLLSTRGFPLGEHGTVGDWESAETSAAGHNELHHVPLMVRFPESDRERRGDAAAVRCGSLVDLTSVIDLVNAYLIGDEPAVDRWLDPHVYRLPDLAAESVQLADGSMRAIQTHTWKLIHDQRRESSRLYAKPDDLWEVNDVSRRCPQVVAELVQRLGTVDHATDAVREP